MCIELQKINLRLLSQFVAILIHVLFKESYATKIAVVGKLYVLPALPGRISGFSKFLGQLNRFGYG